MRLPSYRLGVILAFILQVGLLGWLVADRAMLIANGKEIRLEVLPVDPADLFRGDYVTLNYAISRIASTSVDGDDDFNYQDPIYVTLADDGAGGWKATAISHAAPAAGVFLKGTVHEIGHGGPCAGVSGCTLYSVAYNLEQWFVPEGTGHDIDSAR
ncbi:MAG TPA: GDYXXLXY domain-containing protein, partial [Bauldia sp.]|nr:GDYXXLXY domain-containing protein [Bauldia sp.]